MAGIIDTLQRFSDWCRHAEARHPVRYILVYWASLMLTISAVTLLSRELALFELGVWLVSAIPIVFLQVHWWRPGGMKRNRYDRWLETRRAIAAGTYQAVPAAWHVDATRRHRLRYWDGTSWTAWVADGDAAFIDDGTPIAEPYTDPAKAAAKRSRPAVPLLLGFALGGPIGAALIIAAFAYPQPIDFLFGEVGSDDQLGGIWLLTAAAIVVGVVSSIAFGVRTPVRVAPPGSPGPARVESKSAAFAHSFGATTAVAIIAAWPTWVQGWPGIFALVVLAGLVGIALVSAILAVKVSRYEHRSNEVLRSPGFFPALRGAFVTATGA